MRMRSVGGLLVACVVAACALGAAACKKGGGGSGGKPVVVASIFPVFDLARRVGGDVVHVELLLPAGRGVHDYNPTTKDAKRVAGAKLAFIIGLDLDEWTTKIVEAAGGDTKIVALGERVETKRFQVERVGEVDGDHDDDGGDHDDDGDHDGDHDDGGDHEDGDGDHEAHGDGDHEAHGDGDHEDGDGDHEAEAPAGHAAHHHHRPDANDPHVWLSVPLAIEMVDAMAAEMTAAWPEHKDAFAANAERVKGELRALHDEISSATAKFSKKAIVTFHGSFSYFAAEYGLDIVAVIEPYPGKEPSAAYLKEVLEAIHGKPIGALYTEPQLDPRPAEVLAKEAGLPLRVLDPVGGLSGRDSYDATMRFNLGALAESLE